jgi:hypothetical protein
VSGSWEAGIDHHREADDLGSGFDLAEDARFRHGADLSALPRSRQADFPLTEPASYQEKSHFKLIVRLNASLILFFTIAINKNANINIKLPKASITKYILAIDKNF